MKLANFTEGRDNNFNLIRIVAALAVLVSHSFALVTGVSDAQPFAISLGMTLGTIAVDVFFITSGFLVTASLLTRQSAIEFIWARVLRIYPALLVMLLLTVFGLGVFFTTLPLSSYLTDFQTYKYLRRCMTLITGIDYYLPGVFENNPYKMEVNSSLWTMTFEIKMYAILAFSWVGLRVTKKFRFRTFELLILTSTIAVGVYLIARHFLPFFPAADAFSKLFFMFFSGAAFYVLKEHIILTRWYFLLFVIALLSAAFANKDAFFVVYTLTIAYVLFYLAYIPSGRIRKYNRLGDYSYGVYIYAYPVQQSVAALVPGVSVLSMMLISASITLVLAAISWHFLERRALGLKGHFVGYTRRIFGKRGMANP